MHVCSNMHMFKGCSMRELTKLLKALSDESRLRVLTLLLEKECCVCEVMQAMNISQSKASRALTALYDAGILRQRKDGRWVIYSIDKEGMKKYMNDIVLAASKALIGNPLTEEDLERLKKAERVGPGCVGKFCECPLPAEASKSE